MIHRPPATPFSLALATTGRVDLVTVDGVVGDAVDFTN